MLLPDEPGYHRARQVWNAMVDRKPAVIARCASPADVARFQVVGADGEILHASQTKNPGLAWGLRGGGDADLARPDP